MRFVLSAFALFALAPAAFAQDPKASAFPRRMLFVHIGGYFYLNPSTHGTADGADRVRDAAGKLAFGLRVPNAKDNDQLFVLSDPPATDANLPTRDVLAKTLDLFCGTTRAQDRVVIYFGVHALERDGKAFVAPIDGDPDAPATLLPVADVYAKLKEVKAAQKVVIWDVCRRNPERVRGRRDPGPMTPELFKALTTAPKEVQVLVGCSAGEYSRESTAPPGANAGSFPGSIYLNALRRAGANDRIANPEAKPGEAIPIESLHKDAVKLVALAVKGQTPALAGEAPKEAAAFNAKEPPAKRFELPALPKDVPGEVKAILDELALPPVIEGDSTKTVARVTFAEAALKDYATDVSVEEVLKDPDKYPLRVMTLRTLQTIRNTWKLDGKEQKAVHVFPSPITGAMKRSVTVAQESVAITIVGLELELDRLKEAGGNRAKETKRWQAHYDYAIAEVRLRLVILNEYNRALGNIKTEALPDLPAGATGWRLTPATKLEAKKDVLKLYQEAKEGFEQVAADHKGTPWAVLAKRSLATLPGARWEPIPPLPEGK